MAALHSLKVRPVQRELESSRRRGVVFPVLETANANCEASENRPEDNLAASVFFRPLILLCTLFKRCRKQQQQQLLLLLLLWVPR